MTSLGVAVAEKTGRDLGEVENLLRRHRIELSAATPAPKHLVFRRLAFKGTKTLTGVSAEGVTIGVDDVEHVPFEFDWEVGAGLHGVGSDLNLRGKSSILYLLMWALRGRNGLRGDVVDWIDRVDCEFDVDETRFHVGFNIVDGNPVGELTRTSHSGSKSSIGRFSDDDEFETLMDRTLLEVLGLPVIPGAVEGRRVEHTWQAYASALLVNGDTLNFLIGEYAWNSLPSRLLQMFVGADWSAVRAQATTALNVAEKELAGLKAQLAMEQSAAAANHRQAQAVVDIVRARLDGLPEETITIDQLDAALAALGALEEAAPDLQRRLLVAKGRHRDAVEQLRAAEAQQHSAVETEIAARFFHNMQPVACPRCSAPVTAEQRKAEADGATCSVCTHGLAPLQAVDADKAEASSELDDEAVDDIEAVRSVVSAASAALASIEDEHEEALDRRQTNGAVIAASRASQAAVGERRQIEMDLARAEGAASALEPSSPGGDEGPDEIAVLSADVKVLKATKKLTDTWVTDAQAGPLADLGEDIIELARSFGMVSLNNVQLGGGATLKVWTGGQPQNYGDCERGEQLRLKLATAIALIRLSRATGVGRHPGLLMVDSLAAEEIPEADFEAMLGALHQIAQELDIQVFVATRHTDSLEDLLGTDRCRLGRGTNFVW